MKCPICKIIEMKVLRHTDENIIYKCQNCGRQEEISKNVFNIETTK